MMPGTATPGEMEPAMSMGLDVVKFFPAEQNGGVAKLKAVAGPYTNLRWMPTVSYTHLTPSTGRPAVAWNRPTARVVFWP